MSNLRNPELRTRDIRKIISYKFNQLKWDKGFEDNNEWVFTSTENNKYRERLLKWLDSKCISKQNDSILTDSSWIEPKKIIWGNVIENPEKYFLGNEFTLYDIDLNWVLEFLPQGVSRFGRYS